MTPLPEDFCHTMRERLGEEAEQLFAALDAEPSVAIRLNPAKQHSGEMTFSGEPVAWSKFGRYVGEHKSFTLSLPFHAGEYYVQEAASQFMEYLLRDKGLEGGRILDVCAAPGGKTTLYATLVGQNGLVVANEYVRNRASILADNVRKWGLGNTLVASCDAARLGALERYFDVVAVDAPCSGEGMFRKDALAREEWSRSAVDKCCARQWEILSAAWNALRGGGILLYSTCTLNSEEDEGIIGRFVENYGEEVEAVPQIDVPAEWGIEVGKVGPFQTYRFWPHRTRSEGLFVAIARRKDDGRQPTLPRAQRQPLTTLSKSDTAEVQRWVECSHEMKFALVADTIYGYPAERFEEVKTISGILPVIYSGVAMGQIFKGRLKPDWALSQFVGLNRKVVPTAELSVEEALDYLRKKDIRAALFEEGINLVECQGSLLGFIKRIGARCNNLYPNSLRILNL